MIDWEEVQLGEKHIDLISGFAFKSKNFHDVQEEGSYPVIKIKNVANGDVNLENVVYHKYNESLERFILSEGDVLIAMTGNHPSSKNQIVGDVSKYKLKRSSLLNQRVGKIICKGANYVDFFYYFFKNNSTHNYLASQSSGSANQANISKKDILGLEAKIPPPPEQKAIAEVLSSLDDKIDLLHRQNRTLEQMAETLFRQWFVEEAEESWREGVLGDISENIKDGIKVDDILPEMKYVALEHINKKEISLTNYASAIGIGSNKFKFQRGDILFGKLRPYFHKVCFAHFEGICSTDILVIRPKNIDLTYFCLFAYFQKEVVDYSNSGTTGTRMPRTNWNILSNYRVKLPDREALRKFNRIVESSVEKMENNIFQIQTLVKLRDILLPKLMRGDIRVKY